MNPKCVSESHLLDVFRSALKIVQARSRGHRLAKRRIAGDVVHAVAEHVHFASVAQRFQMAGTVFHGVFYNIAILQRYSCNDDL
jgi:hypothetical protein